MDPDHRCVHSQCDFSRVSHISPSARAVYMLFVLDSFQSAVTCALTWSAMCSGWGRPEALEVPGWGFSAIPAVSGIGRATSHPPARCPTPADILDHFPSLPSVRLGAVLLRLAHLRPGKMAPDTRRHRHGLCPLSCSRRACSNTSSLQLALAQASGGLAAGIRVTHTPFEIPLFR